MRMVVLGSGVVGVTSAWFLARDGHEVVVVDRHAGPAEGTSYANAGLVSPGHAQSWASPRAPGLLLRSLWDAEAAVRMRLRWDPAMWLWGMRFLANCSAGRARANTRRKMALCLHSLDALHRVVAETGIDYHRRTGGILYLHRTQASLDGAAALVALVRAAGLEAQLLDAAACAEREPALSHMRGDIAGGVLVPRDESGDCHLFTRNLAERCTAAGVTFRHGVTVERLTAAGGRVVRIETDAGPVTGDGFVLALGPESAALARPLGIRLPIYPLKGYGLTLPAGPGAPAISGVDEERHLAWSRFGDRLRLTSVAELGGHDRRVDPDRVARIIGAGRALFPDGADWGRVESWAGLRPMTPDGLPCIGRSSCTNLWLNTGHGSLGWSMSCGSAQILADLVAGRKPSVEPGLWK